MKIFYFFQNSSNIFSVILTFMQLSRFRQLDYVILLNATVLGMTLKALLSSYLFLIKSPFRSQGI